MQNFFKNFVVCSLAVAWVCCGCAKRPENPAPSVNSSPSGTSKPVAVIQHAESIAQEKPAAQSQSQNPVTLPNQDLEFLQEYQKATAYSDVANLNLTRLLEDGRVQRTKTTIETRLEKPNRIKLQVQSEDNSVVVVSDGEKFTARIVDPLTNNFHGQKVVRELPENLSIADIYQVTELVDPIAPDEILSALLAVPTGLDVLPFSLLLSEGKLWELCRASTAHENLGDMELPTGERCDVYAAQAEEGRYRIWIHEDRIRRIELPPLTQNLLPGVKQLSLSIDFANVKFQVAKNDFRIQAGGTQVRQFVLPPVPPITDKLGDAIPALLFQDENRQEVRVQNDDSQTTVLVWYGNHPESQMVLQAIEQVRRRNRSDRVRLAAVAAESNATPELLEQWQVETAWLEDNKALGRDVLGIQQAPTVIVLGPKNRLDYFEVGAKPSIGADVAVVLERLLAGQNVAESTKSLYQENQTHYDRILARVKFDGDGWVENIDAVVPKAQPPKNLQLDEKWTTDAVKEPGNFLWVPGKQKQLLVMDGWNRIAMLDLAGEVRGKIELDLPENEGVSILRAASNGRDRALLAATSRGGRQAFLFDFAGKKLVEFPTSSNEQITISDILVHNIAKSDPPELIVGCQGNGGVHSIGLDGKHRWTNQATPGVITVSVARERDSGTEQLPVVTTSESGLMFMLDEAGRTLREVQLPQVVHQLASWPGHASGFETILNRDLKLPGKDGAWYLGVTSSSYEGRMLAGISRDWNVIWSHSMPRGVYRHQIDFIQTVSIPEIGPTWLVAGPDGSIHFVSADGKFRDQMYVGDHLRGIAATTLDDKSTLVLATDGRIQAFEVSKTLTSGRGTP